MTGVEGRGERGEETEGWGWGGAGGLEDCSVTGIEIPCQ